MHTLWNQLLLERSLDLFNTLQICYRHIEDVHEEVWCRKNIFWQTYRVFYLAIFPWPPSNWWLIVYTLWNQLLLELSLDLFNTLKICCRYIEDVHDEVWCRKNIFWQTYRVFILAIFSTLWRYVADILKMCMKKFDAEKIFFDKQYAGGIKSVVLTARFHSNLLIYLNLRVNISPLLWGKNISIKIWSIISTAFRQAID